MSSRPVPKSRKKMGVKNKAVSLADSARRAKAAAIVRKQSKLAALIALIRRRKDRIVEDFYDIGEALRTILRDKLYEARATTFEDLLDHELDISPSTAYRLIAVVDHLPRDKALALGQDKAYALVTYASATPADDTPLGLLESGAKIGRKPIAELGANDLKRAAAAVRKKSKPTPPLSAETRETIRQLLAAVRDLGLPRPTATVRGAELVLTIPLAPRPRARANARR